MPKGVVPAKNHQGGRRAKARSKRGGGKRWLAGSFFLFSCLSLPPSLPFKTPLLFSLSWKLKSSQGSNTQPSSIDGMLRQPPPPPPFPPHNSKRAQDRSQEKKKSKRGADQTARALLLFPPLALPLPCQSHNPQQPSLARPGPGLFFSFLYYTFPLPPPLPLPPFFSLCCVCLLICLLICLPIVLECPLRALFGPNFPFSHCRDREDRARARAQKQSRGGQAT